MNTADAGPGPRDSGPYVKSLRDVQMPADIASAVTSAGCQGEDFIAHGRLRTGRLLRPLVTALALLCQR